MKWVSVEDRLPELTEKKCYGETIKAYSDRLLLFVEGSYRFGVYANYGSGGKFCIEGCTGDWTVVYWSYLTPPKGAGE